MCAIFAKVWFYGVKNSISASDSLQTESPIKLWAIHTPTLLDNYALLKILLYHKYIFSKRSLQGLASLLSSCMPIKTLQ